jgi:hypothetical protein
VREIGGITPSVYMKKAELIAAKVGDSFHRIITSPRFSLIFLPSLLAWEFCVILSLSGRKFFWYDELYTLRFATLQPFSRFLHALESGVDAIPAFYYFMVRLAGVFPGDPHVIIRLPSILGYLLTLMGVYWFLRAKLPVAASVSAVLLITLSPFRFYAMEARSYSLLVGFLVIAAVFWQKIDQKPFMTPLFALFLALCVATHYYAIVALSSFAVAELTWTLVSRRIRWGVWVAFPLATIPFFLGLPILLRFRNAFAGTFWSKPSWGMVVTTYDGYFGLDRKLALFVILFFAVLAGQRLVHTLRGVQEEHAVDGVNGFSLPEIVLIGGFLFYPAFLVVLTKLSGGGYTARYGWPGIVGIVFALVFSFRASLVRSCSAQILGALLLVFIYQAREDVIQLSQPRPLTMYQSWTTFADLSHTDTDLPVVVGSPLSFLEAAQYSPVGVRQRLVQLISSADKGYDLVVRFFAPLKFENREEFEAAHPRFLLCSGGYGDEATPYFLKKRGYRLILLSEYGGHSLYMVEQL